MDQCLGHRRTGRRRCPAGRHPGGRPRRRAARPRGARPTSRSRFTELREAAGLARSHHLAAARRPGAHPTCVARDDGGGYVAGAAVRALRRPARPARRARPRWPVPMLERLSDETGETVNLARRQRRHDVVQIAQVDSTYLLGAVTGSSVEVPAALLGARQGALRLRRARRSRRAARAPHRRAPSRTRPPLAADLAADPPPRLRRHRRRARARASPASPHRSSAPTARVVAALGRLRPHVPPGRLTADRLDRAAAAARRGSSRLARSPHHRQRPRKEGAA